MKSHAVIAALFLVLRPRAAYADDGTDSSAAIAQALFEEGTELLRHGDGAACSKLAESQRLAPAGGTIYNLAICLESQGKTASAYVAYDEALARAVKDGQHERESTARDRMEALRPKLVRFVVRPPDGPAPPGVDVRLDGVTVRAGGWNTPLPVDPGHHAIDATAPSRTPLHVDLTLDEAGRLYEWRLPELAAIPPPLPPASEGPRARRSRSAVLPATLFTSGGVLVAAGGVAGLLAANSHAESDAACPTGAASCSRAGVEAENDAMRYAWAANLGLGLGLVALAAGAYFLFAR